ncbi:CaiB/BaiF CoA transferase family protein [Burkholderia pseudomallei]|uniref:CaiB/BaiF CoA transferase family protein n=1 Tax=Burkholderia pseudomallei TaxID=28450 RepID=UPI000531F820|nr:CaiB/BaiF CoA-transferase family protein [Burkholderia pseudomallei]KGS07346.1 coA-transferase III family protein [Burkholderia pseudomallei MSHR7504]KGW06863.1 coA-transferase III family protein [Burkholderia pseudomallei MSHR4303]KKB69011.1 coA-transferase III family protein [Burkholderia pseudomallei MSHR1079]ONB81574.1 CoA-transferase [Burkholderia pseudomallei]ONC64473.1 CoA-transferase [Burkholderia pseudomallei]
MRNEPGARPLAGIKVLDFSRVLAGPWCAMVLADLGAEVIKIEHPRRGDDTRDWGLRVGDTETTYFNSVNRSKRSICVDLQTQAGRRIARELAAQADVVVHNFKAGGAEKLGLGYDALAALNPRLVHCAISGYDRSGPEAGRPGYDLVVQGEAGLMALNGEAGRPPLKFGVAVADLFTGMYSAQAILAALYERHATGRGRRIEMALFDCGLMVTSYYGLEALLMGEDPPRYGNAHPSIVPYGVFDAADGPIVITVGNNPQFARFCNVIGRPELAADARFATNIARSANRAALLPEILRELGRRPRAALLAALADAGIPCGEVLGLREALTSERARSAGLVTRQLHPVAGEVDVLAPPYRFDGERLPVRGAPPVLGADTDRVLGEWLGMSGHEIAQLRSERVV